MLIKQAHQNSVIFPLLIFLDKGFKFQSYVCYGCHDLLMMPMNLNDISILNVCGINYCCNFYGISKSNAINLLQNANVTDKNIIKIK